MGARLYAEAGYATLALRCGGSRVEGYQLSCCGA